jgi:hypothetical protein
MNYFCEGCGNLDKRKKEINKSWYRYGCKINGYIIGFIQSDKELKTMGCSGRIEKSKEAEQISLF